MHQTTSQQLRQILFTAALTLTCSDITITIILSFSYHHYFYYYNYYSQQSYHSYTRTYKRKVQQATFIITYTHTRTHTHTNTHTSTRHLTIIFNLDIVLMQKHKTKHYSTAAFSRRVFFISTTRLCNRNCFRIFDIPCTIYTIFLV